MTFNLRYPNPNDGAHFWENRKEIVFETIREFAPDVLGVQEAYLVQNHQLEGALPEYSLFGVGRNDGEQAGEHCTLLYRKGILALQEGGTFWLSETPNVVASRHWGNRLPRICTWARFQHRDTEQCLTVYNVHLDHESQEAREKGIGLLLEMIREQAYSEAVVVIGDFNAEEGNRATTLLLEARFVDTFRAMHPTAEAVSTFHGFTGERQGDKIDYIFASPAFQVHSAEIVRNQTPDRFASDHFPVTATLVLTS
jgi:endonuclease/exonuclease/phosphatase family metal-dependent hydrolase